MSSQSEGQAARRCAAGRLLPVGAEVSACWMLMITLLRLSPPLPLQAYHMAVGHSGGVGRATRLLAVLSAPRHQIGRLRQCGERSFDLLGVAPLTQPIEDGQRRLPPLAGRRWFALCLLQQTIHSERFG